MIKILCKILGIFLLLSLNCRADCRDDPIDLTRVMSTRLGKSEIIAVVKGHVVTKLDPETEFYVDYMNVTDSWGLDVRKGLYQMTRERFWGQGCIFYAENIKYHNFDYGGHIIYFSLSRIHGQIITLPEGVDHVFSLKNGLVTYSQDGYKSKVIAKEKFEKYLLRGIPMSLWRDEKTNSRIMMFHYHWHLY